MHKALTYTGAIYRCIVRINCMHSLQVQLFSLQVPLMTTFQQSLSDGGRKKHNFWFSQQSIV